MDDARREKLREEEVDDAREERLKYVERLGKEYGPETGRLLRNL